MPQTSDRRRLAELALAQHGADLTNVVTSLRTDGFGWRLISRHLCETYDVAIDYTTIRRWFSEDVAA